MTDATNDQPAAPPPALVLDSNVFMRSALLQFVTGRGLFSIAAERGVPIHLVATQRHEIQRNVCSSVLSAHLKIWNEWVEKCKKAAEELAKTIPLLERLGTCPAEVREQTNALRARVGQLAPTEVDSDGLWAFVAERLEECHYPDAGLGGTIAERAQARIQAFNPPCSDKKDRHQGDCEIWELVSALLAEGSSVWFSTADSDFCHERQLHPFLKHHLGESADRLRFFYEDPQSHKPYGVMEALADLVVEPSPAESGAVIDSRDLRVETRYVFPSGIPSGEAFGFPTLIASPPGTSFAVLPSGIPPSGLVTHMGWSGGSCRGCHEPLTGVSRTCPGCWGTYCSDCWSGPTDSCEECQHG